MECHTKTKCYKFLAKYHIPSKQFHGILWLSAFYEDALERMHTVLPAPPAQNWHWMKLTLKKVEKSLQCEYCA